MVKKFNIEGNNHTCTPMSISVKISLDSMNKCVDSILYRSMIESQLYINVSRPHISFNVSVYVWSQFYPKESHLTTVKRILKIP
jgi:hypothetical protein